MQFNNPVAIVNILLGLVLHAGCGHTVPISTAKRPTHGTRRITLPLSHKWTSEKNYKGFHVKSFDLDRRSRHAGTVLATPSQIHEDKHLLPRGDEFAYQSLSNHTLQSVTTDFIVPKDARNVELQSYSVGDETRHQVPAGLLPSMLPHYNLSSTRFPPIHVDPSSLLEEWKEEPLRRISSARFSGVNGSEVNAQMGSTAKLRCRILNRSDRETVSWLRLRDHHLITVGHQVYSRDDRISVSYSRTAEEWTLHVRYSQPRDAGLYACQVATHPPMVQVFDLVITQAVAELQGGAERHVQEGSLVNLTCLLRQHTEQPEYVFWYHNNSMINFDKHRQVSVAKSGDGSVLTLSSVRISDSGNYSCLPAGALSASQMLHVTSGHNPEPMLASASVSRSLSVVLFVAGLLLCLSEERRPSINT